MDTAEYTSQVKVEQLGDSNTVQEFEAMMSRTDSPDWVRKAFQSMKDKIYSLVEDSVEGDTYQKILECLVALRKGCISKQEPEQFNDFLRHLNKFCHERHLDSLSDFLASNNVMLISKSEEHESNVPETEARVLPLKNEP